MSEVRFLAKQNPVYCCMVQAATPERVIELVKKGLCEGAGAFGYQQCRMPAKYRDEKNIKSIFAAAEGKPVYVTNYRGHENEGLSDDDLAEGLVSLAKAGASLCDVPADFFCPDPIQITYDKTAVDKQMKLVDRIHEAGAEVLLSSHTGRFMTAEEVLEIANEQKRRGADIVKIVSFANSEQEQLENLRITRLLHDELGSPYLFLSGGTHTRLHRILGPTLGCSLYLCVAEHDDYSTKEQPLISDIKTIVERLKYTTF